MTELQLVRQDFAERRDKNASYPSVACLWEKGADTLMLTSEEMRGIEGIFFKNPHVFESLE